MVRARTAALPAVALFAALAACSDSTGPAGQRSVSVSFSTTPSGGGAALSRGASYDVIVGGGSNDSLVIDTAQVVLRKIELASATASCAADDSIAGDAGCEEINVGPAVVSLPLTAGVGATMSAVVPVGSYGGVEFELHKVGSDSSDAAFAAAHPELADASVRVTGTYRGQRFVFKSAVNESLEMAFSPALVVDSSAAYVTVAVDVAAWFTAANGGALAPTANNANQIGDRIRASFRAFRDANRDGRQD